MEHKLKLYENYFIINDAKIQFDCYLCSKPVQSTNVIYNTEENYTSAKSISYDDAMRRCAVICPNCGAINQIDFDTGEFLHNALPDSKKFERLPEDVERVFNQAKDCYRVCAYDAVTMLLRKLIMHVGVIEGLEEGKSFNYYVGELHKLGLIPPKSKGYVDRIRESGNEISHEIKYETKNNADDLLKITEVLLLNVYEYADDNNTDDTNNTK